MRVCIVTPAPPRSRAGNRVTALRWAGFLRAQGHHVRVRQLWHAHEDCDLLVALHAKRSAESVVSFRERHAERPIVVALTGTDVYPEGGGSMKVGALEFATRIVALQPRAARRVPEELRDRVRVVYQSAPPCRRRRRDPAGFEVCVLGHLRAVKDPFLAAKASRLLPSSSRVRVIQLGSALDDGMRESAEAETRDNDRYFWAGDMPHSVARNSLAGSALLVVSSRSEGASNAISEALASGIPVLSTRIEGALGILGEDYPGYYEVGDAGGLADLLERAEEEGEFLEELKRRCHERAELVKPQREVRAWQELLEELEE